MNQESLAILDRIVQVAAVELFAAYHVQLDPSCPDSAAADDIFSATLGFTNPLMRGAIIITVSRDLVVRSLPSQLTVADTAMVADWTGELANQLLGRIKKQLIMHGLAIVLSTPVVFSGKGFEHYASKSLISRVRCLGQGADRFEVIFEADAVPGFELVASGAPDTSANEGEVSLF